MAAAFCTVPEPEVATGRLTVPAPFNVPPEMVAVDAVGVRVLPAATVVVPPDWVYGPPTVRVDAVVPSPITTVPEFAYADALVESNRPLVSDRLPLFVAIDTSAFASAGLEIFELAPESEIVAAFVSNLPLPPIGSWRFPGLFAVYLPPVSVFPDTFVSTSTTSVPASARNSPDPVFVTEVGLWIVTVTLPDECLITPAFEIVAGEAS